MKVLFAQLYPTICDTMDYSQQGSSVCVILQARIMEWVNIPFSRGSSQLRDPTQVSCRQIVGRFFTVWATRDYMHICINTMHQYIIINSSYMMLIDQYQFLRILCSTANIILVVISYFPDLWLLVDLILIFSILNSNWTQIQIELKILIGCLFVVWVYFLFYLELKFIIYSMIIEIIKLSAILKNQRAVKVIFRS